VPVFPTDVLRHFMYSLHNPSESERPFSPLEEPVLRALGRRGGGARNRPDSYALRQGRHAIGRGGHRIQKPWAVGSGVVGTVGGRDVDLYKAASISSAPLHSRIFFRFITSYNNPVRESL
jgi:hypothetical protein